jgi:phenylpyruvate tautomerase PptA (4-oxalocrotonate tautomerase family)
MPSTQIEIRQQYTPAEEVAIIDAVQASLVAAFKIPVSDRDVRLVVHEPHRFLVSPRLTEPERFTFVSIDCFAGRSLEAKRNLYGEIVERLAALGIPRDHVTITLREIATENWGVRGGQAACDVDLGFEINV